ncbi:hypothetical protein LPJ59_000171 [Coemansia sp. RSA 2399]|nr:hypothetical protein LPJ59_000171 [Coemansia sp. RSA 2399]KAJ1905884.1 hypothetical protein LPJ81_001674 [Coemansia sp. IMI 209127]
MSTKKTLAYALALPSKAKSEDLDKGIIEYLKILNYKYELMVGHYVLDFWEKVIVNVIVVVCVVFVLRMLLGIITPLNL